MADATPRAPSAQAVLAAVLRRGPVSRAELARITGLSKQTASDAVRALQDEGWLRVRGQTSGGIGRSATTYEARDDAASVLGIDLGGTKLHAALAGLAGVIGPEAMEPTDPRGGRHLIRQIGRLTASLLEQAAAGPLRHAAIGSPGVLDPQTGRILIAPNIPGLDQMDVGAELAAELGCPVLIENDVNLAAKGEQVGGACRDVHSFAFVALGTGIGMGVVADGRLLRGARGAAGEIAYLPLGADPFDSRTHRLGTLETAVGAAAILGRYHALGGPASPDVRTVFERLPGDHAAAATLDQVAHVLAQALLAIRAVLDPDRIVLGGSIGSRPELLTRVQATLTRLTPEPPSVQSSLLGPRAALVGAVGVALEKLHQTLLSHA